MDRRTIPETASEGFWRAPDGAAIRRVDFSPADADDQAGGRGWLLFLPGRGDSYEKYLESLSHWCGRGWRVTALDWRGQAGSGRLGEDATTGHIDDFGHWVEDLRAFWVAERPAGKAVVVAHSMGGHLVLRALAENAIDPAATVLVAPMLGFVAPPLPRRVLHLVARVMAGLGRESRPAWKISERPGSSPLSRQALLTHDDERYADELHWRETRPELAMGPGSWRWVERAYASFGKLARRGMLEAIDRPVLILGTTADRLVSWRAIVRAVRRLPRAELVTYGKEARHELLREKDSVRDDVIARIDRFLETA